MSNLVSCGHAVRLSRDLVVDDRVQDVQHRLTTRLRDAGAPTSGTCARATGPPASSAARAPRPASCGPRSPPTRRTACRRGSTVSQNNGPPGRVSVERVVVQRNLMASEQVLAVPLAALGVGAAGSRIAGPAVVHDGAGAVGWCAGAGQERVHHKQVWGTVRPGCFF